MFRLVLILITISSLTSRAQDYDLELPPGVITEYRMESISIVTKAEMELGKLPDHPKITWLGYSSIRLPNKYVPNNPVGEMQTDNRIYFIANTPGIIEFPPIPIILENKEFFIRIGEFEVARNTASKTSTRLEVLWNNQPEIPKEVHLGEAVEIQFIEYARHTGNAFNDRASFSQPLSNVNGAQWHQYVRYAGRKPVPSDYFFTYAQGLFSRYGAIENYEDSSRRIDDFNYDIRTYKARLYFTKTGKASGHLSATLGTNRNESRQRTHVIPFEINVLPIPPLPNNRAFDTGLVGDWQFEAHHRPNQPIASRAFTIDLTIVGQGNPNLRNDFDFSAEGFPSVESKLYPRVGNNYKDVWEAGFTQTLLPTGKVGTLPPVTLASFDTVADQWRFTEITPSFTLIGFSDVAATLTPRTSPGPATTRPVLLNLPVATFGAFALAPFLPFLFGFARRRLDARDPAQKARERTFQKLITNFKAGKGTPEAIDNDLLPILRHRLQLPSGSTVREIAAALDDPELSASLESHAESSFSTTSKPLDYPALASQLAKFSLIILFTFSGLKANTLEEANASFEEANYRKAIEEYQALIDEDPNRSSLYFNLAQAYLLANDPSRARAACHTALLLDPLDKEARDLMSEIRERQGDLTVARNRLFDLRPDQWIILAAVIWIFTFLYFGIRKFRTLPRWPGFAAGAFALGLLATAAWRQTHNYASDQYMVLADELPREPKAGTPDWNYPALRAGQIVQVAEVNETHARVKSSESSFWLPIRELQQVW